MRFEVAEVCAPREVVEAGDSTRPAPYRASFVLPTKGSVRVIGLAVHVQPELRVDRVLVVAVVLENVSCHQA